MSVFYDRPHATFFAVLFLKLTPSGIDTSVERCMTGPRPVAENGIAIITHGPNLDTKHGAIRHDTSLKLVHGGYFSCSAGCRAFFVEGRPPCLPFCCAVSRLLAVFALPPRRPSATA